MKDFTHGDSGYTNYKCRCEVCRKGWSARIKALTAKRRLRQGDGHICRWRVNGKWMAAGSLRLIHICKICDLTTTKPDVLSNTIGYNSKCGDMNTGSTQCPLDTRATRRPDAP